MDSLVLEQSVHSEEHESPFADKQFLFCSDNNNGSYSSQIVMDTTPLSNTGGYTNFQEAFLAIPLVLQVEAPNALLTPSVALDFAVGMKSGFWNILHSLTVEYNNNNVVQSTPYLNMYASYKNLTSWSMGDLRDWGAITGFLPDSSISWLFDNVNTPSGAQVNTMSPFGLGICNNRQVQFLNPSLVLGSSGVGTVSALQQIYQTSTIASSISRSLGTQANSAFLQRQTWLNYSVSTNSGAALTQTSSNQAAVLLNASFCNQVFQAYSLITAGGGAVNGQRAFVFNAIIRLKDICDFFGQLPLVKGASMRLYLNTNQCYLTGALVSPVASATTGAITSAAVNCLTSPPVILGGGGTVPVMCSSSDIGQGFSPLVPLVVGGGNPTQTTYSVALSIVRTQFSQITTSVSAPISTVRLYCPVYTMSPAAEARYLQLAPTKKVVYRDIFQFSFPSVAAGSTFNTLVSNGIPNIREVIVMPLIAQVSNGVASGSPAAFTPTGGTAIQPVQVSSLLSPFSGVGGCVDPIALGNYNVVISGKNLFQSTFQYNFDEFMQQVVSSNQLNGSLTTSLASGLIGYEDWSFGPYRYYVGDASRSMPAEDGVPRSVQIQGQNTSLVTIDLMVFVSYEKAITLQIANGMRIA
jgi:hypothetical protein